MYRVFLIKSFTHMLSIQIYNYTLSNYNNIIFSFTFYILYIFFLFLLLWSYYFSINQKSFIQFLLLYHAQQLFQKLFIFLSFFFFFFTRFLIYFNLYLSQRVIYLMLQKNILIIILIFATICSAISDIKPSQISSSQLLLLHIYHPECKSYPLYLSALDQIDQQTVRQYQVRKLNCANHADFCLSLQKSFPAVYLFFQGNSILYQGQILYSLLYQWIQNLISLKVPTITSDEINDKKRIQSFLVLGGLNKYQKLYVAALKATPFLNINFYQTQSKNPVLRLYTPNREDNIQYSFPLNIRLVSYQIFHRIRDYVMSVDKENYFYYYKNHRDSEQILIFFDHHDQFSNNAKVILHNFCYQFTLSVFCFKVDKQSSLYSSLAHNPTPPQNKSSIIYFKNYKKLGYFFPTEKIRQLQFINFIKEARQGKRTPDFDITPKKSQKLKYSNALQLNDKAYKKMINNNQIVFVKYYSPYCKHCNILAPLYDFVAKHFKDQNSSIVVATIDCQQFTRISDQEGINKYPTFKFFIRGQPFQYQGQRSSTGIIDFLSSLTSAQLFTAFSLKQIKKPALVISGIDQNSTLHFLPALFGSLPIYFLKDEEKLRVNIYWQDDRIIKFTGKVTLNSILKWLQLQGQPILLNLGTSKVSKKLSKVIKRNNPILALMDKGRQSVLSVQNVVKNFCKKQSILACGVARKGQDDYQHLIEWIGDKDQTSNRIVYLNIAETKNYSFRGDLFNLTQQMLQNFVQNVQNGSLSQNKIQERVSQDQKIDKQIKIRVEATQIHTNQKEINTQL